MIDSVLDCVGLDFYYLRIHFKFLDYKKDFKEGCITQVLLKPKFGICANIIFPL